MLTFVNFSLLGDDDPEHMHQQLTAKLDELFACNELVTKHAHGLQRQLTDLELAQLNASPELKQAHEKALLFKISSGTMLGVSLSARIAFACSEILALCAGFVRKPLSSAVDCDRDDQEVPN